jgi:hypothetical protein
MPDLNVELICRRVILGVMLFCFSIDLKKLDRANKVGQQTLPSREFV